MVGLSAATFLARHGIRSIAIERLKASSPLPRAAFFHMRTLEMFRSVGIEDRVREASGKDFVPEGAIIAMDCISGRKLADIIANLNEGVDALSPCRRLFLNQPSLSLVRPDGFVAWRSIGAVPDAEAALRGALAVSLGH